MRRQGECRVLFRVCVWGGDIHLPQGSPRLPQSPEAPRKPGRAPQ